MCMCGIIDGVFCDCDALNASDKQPSFEPAVLCYQGLSLVGTANRCPAAITSQRNVKGGLFQHFYRGVLMTDPGHLQLNREGLPGQS